MNDFEYLISLRKKSLIPYYGFAQTAISLLFLKYIKNKDYSNKFIESLNRGNISNNVINDLLTKVEIEYKLKKNILKEAFTDLNNNINNIDIIKYLNSDLIEYSNKDKQDLIFNIISYCNKDATRTNIYTTNLSLIELITKILDVKDNETFMNTFSGYNLASININPLEYLGYELNSSVLATSLMIFIFLDKVNFNISNEDIYLLKDINKVDKILTDGPWGLFPDKDIYQDRSKISNKMEYHNIDITINALKDNGKAVIVVPNKLLTNDSYKSIREYLVNNRLLEAVVSLPLLSTITYVNPYLLVISKKLNDKVYFIEANNTNFYIQNNKINYLTKDSINKILYGLENDTAYSKAVPMIDLLNQDKISLLVSNYVVDNNQHNYSKKEEIEEKLKTLYYKFNKLINK